MTKSRELTKILSESNAHTAWEQADNLVEQAYGISLEDILEDYERDKSRPQARIRFEGDFAKKQGRTYRRAIRKSKLSKDAYILELLQGDKWVFSAAWHPRKRRGDYTLPCAVLDRICELLILNYDLVSAMEHNGADGRWF